MLTQDRWFLQVSIVLTPQAFHNYRTDKDIFNHSAFAYWNVMVPGEDAWDHIVCTGGPSLPAASLLQSPWQCL